MKMFCLIEELMSTFFSLDLCKILPTHVCDVSEFRDEVAAECTASWRLSSFSAQICIIRTYILNLWGRDFS